MIWEILVDECRLPWINPKVPTSPIGSLFVSLHDLID